MARWITVPAALLASLGTAVWIAVSSLSTSTLDPFDIDLCCDEEDVS